MADDIKSEALRLADALEGRCGRLLPILQAAAELRRLTAVEAERDALKQTLHDELAGNLRLRDLGGARPDEPMLTFLERIIAERDALLEALRDLVQLEADGRTEYESAIPHWDAARAAIAKAEGDPCA